MRKIYTLPAAVTVTNSSAENVFKSYTFDANSFQAGKSYMVRWLTRTTAQNGTDTLTVRARFGSANTISDTAIFTGAAIDQEVSDVSAGSVVFTTRSAPGASVSVIAEGMATESDAPGTPMKSIGSVLSLNTNAALYLNLTGQWSAASASDSAQVEVLEVFELGD